MYEIKWNETDKIGYVATPIGDFQLVRFDDVDYGLYRAWHVTTTGRNFPTAEAAVAWLRSIDYSDSHDDSSHDRPVCHGEMTHAFLAYEASLDSNPY